MTRRGRVGPGGILLLDKPEGPTSHDLVGLVRRVTGYRKVGHGGTLDPFASGLLVLGLNSATRLLGYLSEGEKSYHARIHFGYSTDTDDGTGEILERGECSFDRAAVDAALPAFLGEIDQVPPVVSALKVNGERAYAVYRDRAEKPALKSRRVQIFELEVLDFAPPVLELRVRCGGGTYVRALARDLGEALGCPAHLATLRRESVGALSVANAVHPDVLAEGWEGDYGPSWLPPLAVVADWHRIVLDEEQVKGVRHGAQPRLDWFAGKGYEDVPERAALVDGDSNLVALCEVDPVRGPRLAMVLGEEQSEGFPD